MFSEYVIEFTQPGKRILGMSYNEKRTFGDNVKDVLKKERSFILKLVSENRSYQLYREHRIDLGENQGIDIIIEWECKLGYIPDFLPKGKRKKKNKKN